MLVEIQHVRIRQDGLDFLIHVLEGEKLTAKGSVYVHRNTDKIIDNLSSNLIDAIPNWRYELESKILAYCKRLAIDLVTTKILERT